VTQDAVEKAQDVGALPVEEEISVEEDNKGDSPAEGKLGGGTDNTRQQAGQHLQLYCIVAAGWSKTHTVVW